MKLISEKWKKWIFMKYLWNIYAYAKSLILSVILYLCRRIKYKDQHHFIAIEMWIWRATTTKASWIQCIKMWKFDLVSESIKFIKALQGRRVNFIGHLLRHNEFVTDIIEVNALDKRERGRPWKLYVYDSIQIDKNWDLKE